MEQSIFFQTDCKIIYYLYQLDVLNGLILMIDTVEVYCGDLQECHKKVLKIHILQALILLQRQFSIINQKSEIRRICLKQDNVSFLYKKVDNLLTQQLFHMNQIPAQKIQTFKYFTVGNCLFGAVELTKYTGSQYLT